jgi:hypothetical protein
MIQPEFEAFLARTIPDYAADNVRAGYWSESESLEKSREAFEKNLPQGIQTENHFLYTVHEVMMRWGWFGYQVSSLNMTRKL